MNHTLLLVFMAAAALSPALATIIQQLFAIVIPPAATWIGTEITGKIIPAIGSLGAIASGVINVGVAFLLGLGFTALGLPTPAGLSGLDAATIAAALTAIVRIIVPVAVAFKLHSAVPKAARAL
jgi:hypothetical protein